MELDTSIQVGRSRSELPRRAVQLFGGESELHKSVQEALAFDLSWKFAFARHVEKRLNTGYASLLTWYSGSGGGASCTIFCSGSASRAGPLVFYFILSLIETLSKFPVISLLASWKIRDSGRYS